MATTLATLASSPTSIQLRLGLKCRPRCFASSSVYFRAYLRSVDRGSVRSRAVSGSSAKEGDGAVRPKRSGDSWTSSGAAGDAFSGWVESGADESERPKRGGVGGIVAAGVAGVILAVGLSFVSFYLSKRSASALKPNEETTTQQEMLLSADDHNDKAEQVGAEDINARPDEEFVQNAFDPEGITSENKDPSSPDPTEATFDRSVANIDDGILVTQNVESDSIHCDDLQSSSVFSDMSGTSESNLNIPAFSESELVNDNNDDSSLTDREVDPTASMPDSNPETKDDSVSINLDNPPVVNSEDLNPNIPSEFAEGIENSDLPSDLSSTSAGQILNEPLALDNSELSGLLSSSIESEDITGTPDSSNEVGELSNLVQNSREEISSSPVERDLNENEISKISIQLESSGYINEPYTNTEIDGSKSKFKRLFPDSVSSAGIPAPSLVSAALQVPPGKVLVPAVVDHVQGQALAALQVLKVIEANVQPSDLCSRREYARWLVSASGALSRNSVSKVYPAMYIENVTELAFDDITPEDPDFASIQGLAEAGLISSKLSRNDMLQSSEGEQDPLYFFPESSLSRQDLVSWKMAMEKRQLPEVDKKAVYECCGFIDIDKINPDAWPALVADQSAGEHGIMTLAFGYTRLFQPHKPVTKGQAAIALSTGEAADMVSEELARIEAELMAETAVATHTALVAQVEKDINASFEKELTMEREKIDAIEKMAQEASVELERLRAEREEENNSLIRQRAAVESEMQVLSSLRREVEEQLQSLMTDKVETSFERERINKLRKEAESENEAITRLQYELEVERKALSMARAWAEDEAKRAREQAKSLEEARDRWEKHGIKVVVDDDLREDATAGVTWVDAGKQPTVDATVGRAESVVLKLKTFAAEVQGKSRLVIERIIFKITSLISALKEWAASSSRKAGELRGVAASKASASVQELQQRASGLSLTLKDGVKRVAEDCRDGVEKISQKFRV